jgi:predicted CXXCH cytochrome family protein
VHSKASSMYPVVVALFMGGSAMAGDVGTFVDEAVCAECHRVEAEAWRGSHHDLAMQEATASTVLADFDDSSFTSDGITTRFARSGDKFVVTTDGPDGKLADFEVRYVFGVTPLQQYLLPLSNGRLQALSIAWDSVKKTWYHLYPQENVDYRDELHWTKASQNWNFMCAECHSTDVEKNYDAAADRYDTRWFQIDVGCQACHGPGATHVKWAEAYRDKPAPDVSAAEAGLQVDLSAAQSHAQIEGCARCHARRSVIAPEYEHGKRLMDTHLPALLDENLYYVDGQIREEVYEYGSFLQSKMASKGLRCSDCHDPHSARLKGAGDALCIGCHNPAGAAARPGIDVTGLKKKRYDAPEHHFHKPDGEGSRCVECHAPRTAYMVVDPRADHSFRIPRPDLSAALGVPNACNGCHGDKSARWAADAIREHAPPDYEPPSHYGSALYAGRYGKSGAVRRLAGVTGDDSLPAIVRATALSELLRFPGESTVRALMAGLSDPDPLLRRVAAGALEGVPASESDRLLGPLLDDPVRAVRIEAAHSLLPVGEQALAESRRASYRAALAELEASYRANEDRVEGRVGLADLLARSGRFEEAEAQYRSALSFDPSAVPAAVNLADLYRLRGDDARAEAVLREALARLPSNPALKHALALVLIRQGRKDDALSLLASAASATPVRTEIVYTYAVALADAGRTREAMGILEGVLVPSRGNRDVLLALAAYHSEVNDQEAAAGYIEQLRSINPDDPALRSMPVSGR